MYLVILTIYEANRSATLIKSFNQYGLCTSYDELQCHHNEMGRSGGGKDR